MNLEPILDLLMEGKLQEAITTFCDVLDGKTKWEGIQKELQLHHASLKKFKKEERLSINENDKEFKRIQKSVLDLYYEVKNNINKVKTHEKFPKDHNGSILINKKSIGKIISAVLIAGLSIMLMLVFYFMARVPNAEEKNPILLFGSGTVATYLSALFALDSTYNPKHILLGGSSGAVKILLPRAFNNNEDAFSAVPLLGMSSDSIPDKELMIANLADQNNLSYFKTQIGTSSLKITIGDTDDDKDLESFFGFAFMEGKKVNNDVFVDSLRSFLSEKNIKRIRIFIPTPHSATRKRFARLLRLNLDSLSEVRSNIKSFTLTSNETDKEITSAETKGPWIVLGNEYYFLPSDRFPNGTSKELKVENTKAKLFLYGRLLDQENGYHDLSPFCNFFQYLFDKIEHKARVESDTSALSLLLAEKKFLNLNYSETGLCECRIKYKSVFINDRFSH